MDVQPRPHDRIRLVRIDTGFAMLEGELALPEGARGVVMFAHGSGSSRRSPRNRYVAQSLRSSVGVATLLVDLLAPDEDAIDAATAEYRFDVRLLSDRVCTIVDWLAREPETRKMKTGVFGASTGAAAALVAAAERPEDVAAVVSRGGRPDLAGAALERVTAPTLLIVGGEDYPVIELNRSAFTALRAEKAFEVIPGATHLFEEPGALEEVARRAARWFRRHLT
jgi:dienelactone hydrolase